MLRPRLVSLAAVAVATLALSACGGGTGSSTDPYGSVSAPAASSAPAPASDAYGASPSSDAAAADAPALNAKEDPKLASIVTDAEGYTLYRFDKDTAKPPTTACVDACATKWPPVTVDPKGKLALDGVDQSTIGLLARPDGTSQLTIAGWPIYKFSGDTAPGSTAGQGVQGTWFAVTPQGKKAAAAAG